MPTRPRPSGSARRTPGPVSETSIIIDPLSRSTASVAEQGAACLRVLVRASWTIRYAARSRSRGNRSPGSMSVWRRHRSRGTVQRGRVTGPTRVPCWPCPPCSRHASCRRATSRGPGPGRPGSPGRCPPSPSTGHGLGQGPGPRSWSSRDIRTRSSAITSRSSARRTRSRSSRPRAVA
jgi:hypothetical protein